MIRIIFMIDDDQDDRELFKEAISKCHPDIEVTFTSEADEALTLLKNGRVNPDAIFLDYHMPRMTGVDCLRELKGSSKTSSIPVVMYTMGGHPDIAQLSLDTGADYYMTKANSFEDLCSDLSEMLTLISLKYKRSV